MPDDYTPASDFGVQGEQSISTVPNQRESTSTQEHLGVQNQNLPLVDEQRVQQQTTTQQQTTIQQQQTSDENLLTGTATMTTSDNTLWQMTTYNNSGLLTLVQPGMNVSISSEGYFENKVIQDVDLSSGMVTLTDGVNGAEYGQVVDYSLDVSQSITTEITQETTNEDVTTDSHITGTVTMTTDNNKMWTCDIDSINRPDLITSVTEGMVVTLSDPSKGFFKNYYIVSFSHLDIILDTGVEGAESGNQLRFEIDVSQKLEITSTGLEYPLPPELITYSGETSINGQTYEYQLDENGNGWLVVIVDNGLISNEENQEIVG